MDIALTAPTAVREQSSTDSTHRFSDYHGKAKIEPVKFEIQRANIVDILNLIPHEPSPEMVEILANSVKYAPSAYRVGTAIVPSEYTYSLVAPQVPHTEIKTHEIPSYIAKKYPAFKVRLNKGQIDMFKQGNLPAFDRVSKNDCSYKIMEAKLTYEYTSEKQQSYINFKAVGRDVAVEAVLNRKCGLRTKVSDLEGLIQNLNSN